MTEYRGIHVGAEDAGFLVNIPIRGTRREQKSLEWYQQPNRIRYYLVDDLEGVQVDGCSFALRAAARGVYEVANGLNAEGHTERYAQMEQNASINRNFSAVIEEESESIWKALNNAEPQLEKIKAHMGRLLVEDPEANRDELVQVMSNLWALRDKTLAKLGLTERFQATLTRLS